MASFAIIPDSACDLSKELRERFGIRDYLRGPIYFPDGREELADLDWGFITPEAFYDSMKGRTALYKTASIPLGEIARAFEAELAEGRDVLSISLSTGLSANYKSCCMVAEELRSKYPDRKIVCVDSLHYSTSLGLMVILAAQKREEGATLEETAAFLETEKYRIHQMGTMDDLFFLVKTGRVSNFKAFFGNMIGLNLCADLNRTGMADVLGKFKGKKDAFRAILEYIDKTIVDPEEQILFVAHSNREEAAKLLAEQVQARFAPKEIILLPVGMSCGANIGPGLCAVFYRGKEISEDNIMRVIAQERAIMDAISADIKRK